MNIKDFLSKSSTKKIISSVVVLILAAVFGITKFSDSGIDESQRINVKTIKPSTSVEQTAEDGDSAESYKDYTFRTSKQLTSHFQKHGSEVGAKSEFEYVDMANAVINNPAALHKTESEDGDSVYFLNSTGEIVFVSTDGFIRTYFISDYDYFNRQ